MDRHSVFNVWHASLCVLNTVVSVTNAWLAVISSSHPFVNYRVLSDRFITAIVHGFGIAVCSVCYLNQCSILSAS